MNTARSRAIVGIVVGGAAGAGLALVASLVAHRAWPAYTLAEPSRSYTLAMLVARLVVGALCVAVGSGVCTHVARDTGRAAVALGTLVLGLAALQHVVVVWAAYPVWYHLVFLSYILPVAAGTGAHVGRGQRVVAPKTTGR